MKKITLCIALAIASATSTASSSATDFNLKKPCTARKKQLSEYVEAGDLADLQSFLSTQPLDCLDEPDALTNQMPLHLAVRLRRIEIIDALLKAGANPEPLDPDLKTPLHIASMNGDTNSIKLLLQANANCHEWDRFKRTPLWYASQSGHIESVLLLLSAGACSNILDQYHWTPRDIAELKGHKRIAEIYYSLPKCFRCFSPFPEKQDTSPEDKPSRAQTSRRDPIRPNQCFYCRKDVWRGEEKWHDNCMSQFYGRGHLHH